MKTSVNYLPAEATEKELHSFITEGLKDVYQNNLLDFDSVFDALEERYRAANGYISHHPYPTSHG